MKQIFNITKDTGDPIYEFCLQNFFRSKNEVSVLQIGAFDGKSFDILYPYLYKNKQWKAVLVEPIPGAFEDLKINYNNRENIQFVNTAINKKTGPIQIWTVPYHKKNDPDLPEWATGCSTIVRNSNPIFGKNCTKDEFNIIKNNCILTMVPGDTLPNVLKQTNTNHIDILHIDTEGYDWEIIKQLNFDKYKPKVIYYEKISLNTEDYNTSKYVLDMFGYNLYEFKHNITAVRKDLPTIEFSNKISLFTKGKILLKFTAYKFKTWFGL